MRDIWLIAKREYLEQVRGKAFKVTTVLVPLVFIGLFALIAVAGNSIPAIRTLGLVRAARPTTWAAVITRPLPR